VSPLAAFAVGARSDLVCPTCGAALSQAAVAGLPLHACTACHGSLIAIRQFVTVIESVRLAEGPALDALPPRTQEPGHRTVSCPACRQPMLSHVYGGGGNLVLDTCETCQLNWLDGGELRRIALSPRRSG
jgi:Zn-finger nucleic acid-binding protein